MEQSLLLALGLMGAGSLCAPARHSQHRRWETLMVKTTSSGSALPLERIHHAARVDIASFSPV